MAEKKTELFTTPNRAYADRYIRENYNRLNAIFRTIDGRINPKCNSSLDILNDTILILYRESRIFADYESFREFADKKFSK